jgi:hypothetical protein
MAHLAESEKMIDRNWAVNAVEQAGRGRYQNGLAASSTYK